MVFELLCALLLGPTVALSLADVFLQYIERAFSFPLLIPPPPQPHLHLCRTQAACQRTHGAMVGEGEAVFGHLSDEERRPELVMLLLLLWHHPPSLIKPLLFPQMGMTGL